MAVTTGEARWSNLAGMCGVLRGSTVAGIVAPAEVGMFTVRALFYYIYYSIISIISTVG